MTICRILEGVYAKNLKATLLFVDFSQAFDPIHRWMMEQILLPYGLPKKKTIAAIMMQYKNTKIKDRPQEGETEYVDIAEGVLKGDTYAP